jgi:Family of unknown function (DUF5908)
MPIEIKELHIRVSVDNNTAQQNTGQQSNNSQSAATPDPALVQACVEKVMEIIRLKSER